MTITTLGFLAAICTTASFVPQAIKIIKTKRTQDISLVMYVVFNTGLFLWLAYGILLGEAPIIISNVVTLIFTLIILVLKIRYK